MDGMVEIITGREGRRRWSIEDKLRLVAETRELGARVRLVAVRLGVCESLLFTWRRQVNEGVLVVSEMPVQMLEPAISMSAKPRCDQPNASRHSRNRLGRIPVRQSRG